MAVGGVTGRWKGLKTEGPLGLPNIPGSIRGAKRGAKRNAKGASLDIINRAAKRKLDDLFGVESHLFKTCETYSDPTTWSWQSV